MRGAGDGRRTARQRIEARCGEWPSPLDAGAIVAGQIGLVRLAQCGGELWWSETRPAEGGRVALMRRCGDDPPEEILPAPSSARSRVHEYGGGAWEVSAAGLVFSNDEDRRLWYRPAASAPPRALTPPGAWRFADFTIAPRSRRIVCVREDHAVSPEPANTLVVLDPDGGESPGSVLVGDRDFVASPRISPDGRHLAWLAWDHPNMPWDGCELWLGELHDDGTLRDPHRIAGGPEESIFQPEWSPDGRLAFASDRSGFWNLECFDGTSVHPLCPAALEFGRPQWALGLRTFAFADAGRLVCTWSEAGRWQLGLLELATGRLKPIAGPWVAIDDIAAEGDRAWLIAASETAAQAIHEVNLRDLSHRVLYAPTPSLLAPEAVSRPRHIEFAGRAGRTVHAHFYPPVPFGERVRPDERPPLRVKSHGGPTGAARLGFDPSIQYWTSRGWAVVDVDYAGSTGYGRAYRRQLEGGWGMVDVEDCVDTAQMLAADGTVDPERLTISGRSAGGYTTLCALTFHDVFRAGASVYGIGDLAALAADTHKFESRYTDRLVAPLRGNEALWRARSPLHHVERLHCPVLFLHGLDDRVVPVEQTESMVAALRARGVPVELETFPGEGHGFRRAGNQQRALEAELAFFSRWT